MQCYDGIEFPKCMPEACNSTRGAALVRVLTMDKMFSQCFSVYFTADFPQLFRNALQTDEQKNYTISQTVTLTLTAEVE